MGETKFTDDQKKVIDTRDNNILVSAAAGSGKTTVLVERIIRKIMGTTSGQDGEVVVDGNREPVDIDRILVLTFTNAAAAGMKEKIVNAINDRMAIEKDDKNLARQAVLIHNAQITTIHSFCLFLLRNHFAEVGIDPAFRVANEGEVKLLEGTVADELIAELFEDGSVDNFEMLAERVMTKNSLGNLKSVLLGAYRESRNAPYIDEYFEDRRQDYACDNVDELDNAAWMRFINEQFDSCLDESIERTKKNIENFKDFGEESGYIVTFRDDLDKLTGLRACNGYKAKYEYIQSGNMFINLSTKGMKSIDETEKKMAKAIRDSVKKQVLEKFVDKFYFYSPEEIVASLKQNHIIVNALIDVLQLFTERIKLEKNKRKIIDFGDMEHYALSILVRRENRINYPTQVAIDYAEHFDEIMVDEYQDSNRIQEEILEAISGKIKSRFNRFMVGDVKQSIYSFRQACPDIFIDKYDRYANSPEGCRRIDLSTNFRSRAEVLDSVNSIFERIMSKDMGMVSYDKAARLNLGAEYPENACDNKTELRILVQDKENELSKVDQEAVMVAKQVTELVNGRFMVKDKHGTMRPCRYGDIVILFRSTKDYEEPFKNALEANGVPTFIASRTGYFSSLEVREMMSLLQVLDNPRQEIPLFGTLRGTFGNFSEDEIASIRTSCNGELYDALREVANINENADFAQDYPIITRDIIAKTKDFMAFIDKWREKKIYTLIHILISEIIEETQYMYKIGSLPYGEQRKANVFMLIERAKQYEAGSFKGLYHFVKYIEEIRSYEVDFGEATTVDESANVVRIMTIHSSKGLEFPICFVCGMGKQYNEMFSREDIVYDNTLGIGMEQLDFDLNVKHKDVRKAAIIHSKYLNMAAEEMRILYVALTRAQEKLIMTGVVSDYDKLFEDYVAYDKNDPILPYGTRFGSKSYLKLIASAIGPEGNESITVTREELPNPDEGPVGVSVTKVKRKQQLLEGMKSNAADNEIVNVVKERITYEYPHKNLAGLYTKTSVSELKIAAIEEKLINHDLEGIPAEFFTEHETSAYVPAFAAGEEQVKGTARGTAYHRVMELIDFAGNADLVFLDDISKKQRIDAELERMIKSERVTEEAVKLVDRGKIARFLASDLGHRMCLAAGRGQLHLEEPFVMQISASRLNKDYPENEKVLIQGIIDAFFEEDGQIVLMDYKTDRVSKASELIERYELQLDYYKEALCRIREMPVSQVLIYSFALEETISNG